MARTGYTYDGGEAGALGDCLDPAVLCSTAPAFYSRRLSPYRTRRFLFDADRLGFRTRYRIS
jgi:hypothetical protein